MKILRSMFLLLLAATCSVARGFELFSANTIVSANSTARYADYDLALLTCEFMDPSAPLTVLESAERAMCTNPSARKAWDATKEAAASVGLATTRFIPEVQGTVVKNWGHFDESTAHYPGYNINSKSHEFDRGLNLNWVLYDFGGNWAKLKSARESLLAALAQQDEAIRDLVLNVVGAYYDAQSSKAAFDSRGESEQIAEQNWQVANEKYKRGVVTALDELQARNAYYQAQLERIKAEADAFDKQAALAVLLGLEPGTPFSIKQLEPAITDDEPLPVVMPNDSALVESQPSILAAQAALAAAEANTRAVRAAALPVLSLVGTWSTTFAYPDTSFRVKQVQSTADRTIGIKITVPLTGGFERHYAVNQARAQEDSKAADLRDAEQKAALALSNSYQAAVAARRGLGVCTNQLDNAARSYQVARDRYRNGVGSMVDVLNAQSAYATAKLQRITATASWLQARITLAANLHVLDLSTLK